MAAPHVNVNLNENRSVNEEQTAMCKALLHNASSHNHCNQNSASHQKVAVASEKQSRKRPKKHF